MKLSTAMRIGSMTTQQIIYHWSDGKNGRCALGAIAAAHNINDKNVLEMMKKTYDLFPQLSIITSNPCSQINGQLVICISTLNDQYNWSREKIADWIEDLENKGVITYATPRNEGIPICNANSTSNKQTLVV